ncbi:ATP-dependent DNA helicase PIF1 [Paramuricea clavata]|uniref:ATP-dependent DNA helicase n=1 Tax=Paramuricea clavata TaxID=317549 RepID=A0A6S7HNU5_PARCT|nr:ATP-dependent DNA helicase PIF1 [Paramuricea clavata]
MIRQLGPASLFCSFSSAETKWNHLLRIVGKVVDYKDYSDEQLDNLNWDEKCRLIQSDPVTCARHFDYQFNTFLKDILMSEIAPLGKLKDWFYKAQKGMSDLLRNACAEAKESNSTIKQQVRDIGNKFLNSVEISTQEAVYLILQLPMRKSSRNVVFINTSPPSDRVELLKPLSEIEKMSDESEEIHSDGLLKRYVERPDSLKYITLADWAAWCFHVQIGVPYDFPVVLMFNMYSASDIDNLPLEDEDENNDDDLGVQNTESCVSSKKSIKRRSQARIIRSVWFNKESQPEKHYRELIMLFTPWRNEQVDLMGAYSSFEEHYEARVKSMNKCNNMRGSGGVGKSQLIKSIYQAALKHYNKRAGEDFRRVQVLLLAQTGRAAYLIKGNTIYSALSIPASQSLKIYKPLDSGRLNTLRCELGPLKLILLDEISMVGNSMFTVQLNNRLKYLKGSKDDFGGVSIITIGDLFQLKPVIDGYIFNDLQSLNYYSVLAPNLWKKYFRMFELDDIMQQRESKMFAGILNRLREGKHTTADLQKLKERCVQESNCPQEAPRLFIQNALVDKYNEQVYESFTDNRYTIKAQDSVIGAASTELKEKIMRQIPYVPLRNSKQLAHKLKLAVGQCTEVATNV